MANSLLALCAMAAVPQAAVKKAIRRNLFMGVLIGR
jgi:hypothetical protein